MIGECDWSRVAKDGDMDLSEIKETPEKEKKNKNVRLYQCIPGHA